MGKLSQIRRVTDIGKISLALSGKFSHLLAMEQLIADIETYARAYGCTPQSVLREAIGAGWGTWGKWKDGTRSPTMRISDKVRKHIADNPPPADDAEMVEAAA